MSNKLDFFELTVKRGLDNHEYPLSENAWSDFSKAYHGTGAVGATGTSSSFFTSFAVAATFLVGTLLFINHGAQPEMNGHHDSHIAISHGNSTDGKLAIQEDSADLIVGNASVDQAEESQVISEKVTKKEKEILTRINRKLQEVASSDTDEISESDDRITTRYVGRDFNLDAAEFFTPDNDGDRDAFIPSALVDGDIFIMTILTESGRQVYKTNQVDAPWTGLDSKGAALPSGRYSWEVILQKDNNKDIFKGMVKLVR